MGKRNKMRVDIPENIIEMILNWKKRQKEHNSLSQIGQADDYSSYKDYQQTILDSLYEIFKNMDIIQERQYQISEQLKLTRNSLEEAERTYEFFKNKVRELEGQLIQ